MSTPAPANGAAEPAEAKEQSTLAHLRLGLPKGRMKDGVFSLLAEAGISVVVSTRGYRPTISLDEVSVKLLKPQNILEMLDAGTRDVGFAGYDWVENLGVDVVEVLDTELDPVRVVVAAPDASILEDARDGKKHIVVASEYEQITKNWIAKHKLDAQFVRAFGATESFPPEDADVIVDNTATGSTLKANNLHIIEVVARSSTRLFASKQAWADPAKRKRIEELALLIASVLKGRKHCAVEFNVTNEKVDEVIAKSPCLRAPTVAKLYNGNGFAVKVVIPRTLVAETLPKLKAIGGVSEIVVSDVQQIVL